MATNKTDVVLGLAINHALIAKDGEKIVQAVIEYMNEFGLVASDELIKQIPHRVRN